MALDTEILFSAIRQRRQKICLLTFYNYIQELGKNAGSCVQLCRNLLRYV